MPWFLHPAVYNKLPVYQNHELYLFVLKVLVTVVFAFLLRKRGARGGRLLAVTLIFFYGIFLSVMLFMHNMVILGLRIFERPAGSEFSYDFHLYSLILLGAVLLLQGIKSVRAALRLYGGDENGVGEARRAALLVLAVAIPLIPLQFFGIFLTVLSVLNLAAMSLFLRPTAAVPQAENKKVLLPV
jgi:hypothetical protein